jgi:pyruvate/2-oxoglutarate/acetoin dehydrogenase E1 component
MKFIKSINQALHDVLKKDKNIILYGEDLDDPYGGAFKATKGLSTKFPGRVISTPISEAGIIGMSGGMSIGGLKPVVEIMFSDFILLGADQLLNHLVKYDWMYNNQVSTNVTIRTAIGGGRGYGPTHSQSIEPIIASIPNIKIISPTFYHDPGALLKESIINEKGVKIFCEYKMNYSKDLIDDKNAPEEISIKHSNSSFPTTYISNCLFQSPDITIVSHGGNMIVVEELLIDLLMEFEINANAVFPSIIKPLPLVDIEEGIKDASIVLVLEESPTAFGWSSEVIASLYETGALNEKKIIRLGAKEHPIPSATQLEEKVLPSKNDIIFLLKQELSF